LLPFTGRVAAGCLAMGFAIWFVRTRAIVAIPLGTVVYVFSLFALRVIDREQISDFFRAAQRMIPAEA
ncbi:MAG: hypothetical protein M3Y27_15895, partial [Acidobacteriota bacterium]|nr:hypothetical protein [Acidobacteriota bacterium]